MIIENLKPFLQKHWENAGFSMPTAVQEQTFPLVMSGRDVIAESPTGTGKTLAYMLPCLERIDASDKNIQVVVLASSRELVMQIFEVASAWCKGSDVKVASFIGGVAMDRQLDKLKKKPQFVVGTPGRIDELVQRRKMKMHAVKTMVLDEGDYLLQAEHVPTITRILKSTLKDRQLLLFSATLPNETREIAQSWMTEAEVVQIRREANSVTHAYLTCDKRDKISLLEKLVKGAQIRALAFSNDIGNMTVLVDKLLYRKVGLAMIHGDSKKEEREAAIKGFRAGDYSLLMATDVAARGLDIAGLEYVINMDVPDASSKYIHRAGRTGRQGAEGMVVSIVTPQEVRDLKRIAKTLEIPLKPARLYRGAIVLEEAEKITHKSHISSKQ